MTTYSCDEIEIRVAEALTGEAPMDAQTRAHLQSCASCASLARALRALSAEAAAAEPSAAGWRAFDAKLKARLATGAAPPAPARSRLRVILPLAAAIGALALALWVMRPRSTTETTPAPAATAPVIAALPSAPEPAEIPITTLPDETTPVANDQAVAVLAAASSESLDAGLQSLGITTTWDESDDTSSSAAVAAGSLDAPVSPAPAWGDVLGELEEDLGSLDPAAQSSLARTLREAT